MRRKKLAGVCAWGLAWLAMWLPGCSLVFVEGTPADHAQRSSLICTSSYTAPILDSVYAGAQALALAGQARGRGEPLDTGTTLAQVAFGLVAAGSAYHGFSSASQCEDAEAALARRVAQEQWVFQQYRAFKLAPPPLPPPTPAQEPQP